MTLQFCGYFGLALALALLWWWIVSRATERFYFGRRPARRDEDLLKALGAFRLDDVNHLDALGRAMQEQRERAKMRVVQSGNRPTR